MLQELSREQFWSSLLSKCNHTFKTDSESSLFTQTVTPLCRLYEIALVHFRVYLRFSYEQSALPILPPEVKRNVLEMHDLQNFTVNGNWGYWSAWSDCNFSCGSGTKTRTRRCDTPLPAFGGSLCTGNSHDSQTCYGSSCRGMLFITL